jgi:hypothetical protein
MSTELEALKERVSQLEADVHVHKDLVAAYQKLLISALPVIYRRDPAALREWIADARNTAAFGQAAFDQTPPQTLPVLLGSIEGVLEALIKSDKS